MKNRQAAIGFIFVTVLVDIIGLGIIIPVMPQLITELTGGTISDASIYGGWLMFAYASMQFLFAPVLGGLSDQFGRRKVLLFALFGFGVWGWAWGSCSVGVDMGWDGRCAVGGDGMGLSGVGGDLTGGGGMGWGWPSLPTYLPTYPT